ncbi:T9SS type B sorting domain-containing protein [Crocinitomicaceae bacterium]|nr:T9SS type B sorting domain-containing protein [Crocinitomicaceae bacterium]
MKTLLLLIAICVSSVSFGQVPSYAPTENLVGWWPFNGNANDESVNTNNGTVNGASLTTDRFGTANSAYNFDGVDDFIEVLDDPSLNFPSNNQSISFWVKMDAPPVFPIASLSISAVLSKYFIVPGNGSTVEGFMVHFSNTNPSLLFYSIKTACCLWGDCPVDFSSNYNDIFHHVVYTNDGTILKCYINGVLTVTTALVGNTIIGNNSESMYFGSENTSNGILYFKGNLDDIGMWNRALTQCEISQLYHAQVLDPPVVSLQETVSSCVSSAIIDAGSEPSWETYNWSNGETTQSISTDFSGLYSVAVTDTNGCIGYDTTLVSVINPTINQIDTNICLGETLVLDVTPANSCTPLPLDLQDGLVGYYPFCGNANDESGNGNDGTVNGASLTTDRFGNSNSAYDFDGDDVIQLPSINLSSFSFNAWVKVEQSSIGTASRTIVAKHYNALNGNFSNSSYVFYSSYNPGPYSTLFFTDPSSSPTSVSTSPLAIDTSWHMLTGTLDLNEFKIYRDGVLFESNNGGNTATNNIATTIGAHYNDLGTGFLAYFLGIIDDVSLWNRALSSSEIQQLYEHGNYDISWSTGEITPSITVQPSETTTYTVTVDDGISSCSDDVTITINDLVEAGIDVSVCNGNEITLSGSGVDTYIWSNGVTDGVSFTPGSSSYYYVTGTDSFGCETTDSVFVTLLEPTSSVIIETNCDNYTAPDGASYTVSGTYTAVIQNSVGCDSTITIDLTVLESPELLFEVTEPECQGEASGNAVVVASNGTAPYTFVWNNGALEAENNGIVAGTYEVTVTDNLGCSTQGSVVVIDPTESCFLIPGGLSPNGDGANETWEIGGLSQYPDAIISVFDRWGQKVYSGDYTSPPWDGTYNGSDLPTADYYYILDLGNGEKYNGVVTLKR